MAIFTSDPHMVNGSTIDVSNFIAIPANLIEILPEDRIEHWKSDGDKCSFKIKGLAHISLKLKSAKSDEVIYASDAEKPFSFEMIIKLKNVEGKTKVDSEFHAEVNGFFGTMLKAPMTNFLNHLGKALSSK